MLKIKLLLSFCVTASTIFSQQKQNNLVTVGDTVPPLKVKEWVKGISVPSFEKEKFYVVEFWATWCRPCLQSLPRLSKLARKYKHKANFIAIDVYEKDTTKIEEVKTFVNKMDKRINLSVAIDDNRSMARSWLEASNEYIIPTAYVINSQGKIAWIGHPKKIKEVLPQILRGTWDVDKALADRKLKARIADLDKQIFNDVKEFNSNAYIRGFYGNPDSALFLIEEMIKKEPELTYAPHTSKQTFYSLLKIDPTRAYKYGKMMMFSENPNYDAIIESLNIYPYKYNTLPEKVFELGAQAMESKIKNAPYPLLVSTTENYMKMAEWYLLANNKSKAREALRKAIKKTKKQ